jgi:NAD(P)-dependent dehydrogenase (short-subunit alcohol dehydrogenase family)
MAAARLRLNTVSQHLCPSATATKPKVCLVIGAGAGIGINVGKRFAKEGFETVLVRRSDNEGLQRAVKDIEAAGGRAHGLLVDMIKPGAIEDVVSKVEAEIGPIEVCIYNLGAQIGPVPLESLSHKQFEMGWRLGCEGLFRLAKVLLPAMVQRGGGTVLCTSATSSVRGNTGQHSHGAAVGGRRMLLQSLNHEFAPKGIHLCHIIVDAAVNAPDTLGKLLGKEGFKALQEQGDRVLQPDQVCDTYYHLHTQHRSAWTFELDVRPFSTVPWFNS